MADTPVSVLIVDDQAPFRSAARAVVAMTPGFEVAAEAATGEEALALVESAPPDLVLMDINMPGINGIEAARQITAAHPRTAVILLSTYAADELPADARTCGAATYVNKEEFGPDVLRHLWSEHGPTT
ncbi:MAG: response regulator transcription factor [Actinobacteria bacterium]|nr:response regulator transcription factor [Actinomycetota bacterium]